MDTKTQQQYAETFRGLHKKGDPLVLFNAWDAATAKERRVGGVHDGVDVEQGDVALDYLDHALLPLWP